LCVAAGWVIAFVLIVAGGLLIDSKRKTGWSLLIAGLVLDVVVTASGLIGCLPWDWHRCLTDGQEHSQRQELHIPPHQLTNKT